MLVYILNKKKTCIHLFEICITFPHTCTCTTATNMPKRQGSFKSQMETLNLCQGTLFNQCFVIFWPELDWIMVLFGPKLNIIYSIRMSWCSKSCWTSRSNNLVFVQSSRFDFHRGHFFEKGISLPEDSVIHDHDQYPCKLYFLYWSTLNFWRTVCWMKI